MANRKVVPTRSSAAKPVALIVGLGMAILMFGVLVGWEFTSGTRRGLVRGETAGPKDTDGDGTVDSTDRDDDNDGWTDVDDPLPLSVRDWDNDGLPNSRDTDDDGDGVLDAADRKRDNRSGKWLDLSWDQNNNLKLDFKERHAKPNFDGDRDGIADRREMLEVVRASARRLGLVAPASATSLAAMPPEALKALPANWHFGVTHDRDNNGAVDGLPPGTGRPRDYTHYLDGGTWEETYARYAQDRRFEEIIRCLACEGTERIGAGGGPGSTLPQFSPPKWESPVKHGFFSRLLGAGSPYADYHKYYGGAHSADYGADRPQYVGGEYVDVTTAEPTGAEGATQGTSGGSDGGSWYSQTYFVQQPTSGGDGGTPPSGGGGGGSLGGGGGKCSKC